MPSFGKNTTNVLILITTALCLVGAFVYLRDWENATLYLSALCGAVLIVGILFYNFKWYYLVAIGLIPLSMEAAVLGGAKVSFPSEALLVLAIPVAFIFGKTKVDWKRLLTHPITILLIIDLVIQFFASLLGTHIDVSLKRLLIRVIFILGFYVLVNQFDGKRIELKVFLSYCIGLIPVMYFTFKNHIHHSFNPRVVFSICQPYFNDHTIYGACLAFVIPFLIILIVKYKFFNIKKSYFIGLIVLTAFIVASEILALSRAAILSLGVALVFYLFLHYKLKFKNLLILIGIALAMVIFFKDDLYGQIQQNESVSNDGEIVNHFSSVTNVQSDASNLERINRWICAYRMFEDRPFRGYGPGTYQFEYNQFQTLDNKTYISTNSGNRGNAHSEYLTYLSETGIFGFIVFVLTIFSSIYYGMRNHYELKDQYLKLINLSVLLGLVTFFFHGIFNSFIDQSKMAFLYFGALGIIVRINIQLRARQKKLS